MQRDPRAFLWDGRDAALAIQRFVAGMDAAAYEANATIATPRSEPAPCGMSCKTRCHRC